MEEEEWVFNVNLSPLTLPRIGYNSIKRFPNELASLWKYWLYFDSLSRGDTGDPEFIKKQEQKRSELDEQLREYIAEWRLVRVKEQVELKKWVK